MAVKLNSPLARPVTRETACTHQGRPIPGWPNYFATEDGRIYSDKSGKLIELKQHMHAYLSVQLWKGCKGKTMLVHKLVLLTFVGPCPNGMEACHNNGNRRDNSLGNLRWDSRKANHADAMRHGTHPVGTAHGQAKLTVESVMKIREMVAQGIPQVFVAKQFGISATQVSAIARGRSWSHLGLPNVSRGRRIYALKTYSASDSGDIVQPPRSANSDPS